MIASAALAIGVGTTQAQSEAQGNTELIRFDHFCADAERHQVQAWTTLAEDSGTARAAVRLYARHDPVQREEIFIGLRLAALRVDAGREAGGALWSIRMEARSHETTITGTEHGSYASNPARGEGEERAFVADDDGKLEWLDFAEPGEGQEPYPYNWSPAMETTARALRLSDSAREVALKLVVTERASGKARELRAPAIWIPDRIFHERGPTPRTLGLLNALNPADEGSVWQWLRHGGKYARCIEERRRAKAEAMDPRTSPP